MKVNGLLTVVAMGLLMSSSACANPYDVRQNVVPLRFIRQNAVWPNGVKELPLCEIESKTIPPRNSDPYVQNALGVAQHIFIQRTPHSMAFGARVAW